MVIVRCLYVSQWVSLAWWFLPLRVKYNHVEKHLKTPMPGLGWGLGVLLSEAEWVIEWAVKFHNCSRECMKIQLSGWYLSQDLRHIGQEIWKLTFLLFQPYIFGGSAGQSWIVKWLLREVFFFLFFPWRSFTFIFKVPQGLSKGKWEKPVLSEGRKASLDVFICERPWDLHMTPKRSKVDWCWICTSEWMGLRSLR